MQKIKQKVLDVLWVLGLGFCVGFTLLQFELIAYHQTVDMLTNFFYVDQAHADLTVEHQDGGVEGMIKQVFGKDYKVALAVSWAENGSRQCDRVSKQNKNGTYDIGVFQINTVHAPMGDLYDCQTNIRVAYKLFKEQGWGIWTTYKSGAYKHYESESNR